MAAYLSTEWLSDWRSRWAGAISAPGLNASVCFALTGAKDGPDGYWWKLGDGQLVDSGIGALEDVDITFTLSPADALSTAKGESDLNAGFMQGRVKVAGDSAKLFSVLAVTASPAYRSLVSALAAETEFPG